MFIKSFKNLLISILFLGFGQSWARQQFLPDNNLSIPVNALETSGITLEQFNAAIKNVMDVYKPLVKERIGKVLRIRGYWKYPTVNAFAHQHDNMAEVAVFGGIARFPHMTLDGLYMVLCHEVGHHIGGAPKVHFWASNEGESDYWASLKCFRRMFRGADNIKYIDEHLEVTKIVKDACDHSFPRADESALCQRTAMAGMATASLLARKHELPVPKFETPDTRVVDRTMNDHPPAQCRLDTYFRAAICPVELEVLVSDSDPTQGVCTEENHPEGSRPACWYRP